jgi:hypothetical protein
MSKIPSAIVADWRERATRWLVENTKNATSCTDVKTGRDAWLVAHRAGLCAEAYAMSRDIHDAHIQTALEKVFPNAVFRDAKRY